MKKTVENPIEEIKTRIVAIREHENAEKIRLATCLEDAKKAKEQAAADAQKAVDGADLEAYRKAKEQENIYSDAITVYSERLNQISSKTSVKEDEKQTTIETILTEATKRRNEYNTAILPIVERLRKLTADYNADFSAMDTVLQDWQRLTGKPMCTYSIDATGATPEGFTKRNPGEESFRYVSLDRDMSQYPAGALHRVTTDYIEQMDKREG